MIHLSSIFSSLFDALLSPGSRQTYVGLAMFFAVMVVLEIRAGRGIQRYRSPEFLIDLLYTLLIVGGVYGLLQQPLLNWTYIALRDRASLDFHLIRNLPPALQFLVFLAAVDFFRYWKHRWLHVSPFLWAFHSVHHAPNELNFLTNYRIHVVEFVIDGVFTLVPVMILGPPAQVWIPVNLLLLWYTSLTHSDLDVGYGYLDRVLVSPRFHRVHHSSIPRENNTNFGGTFSVWDRIFGTSCRQQSRPTQYGLGGVYRSSSFFGQLFLPLKVLKYSRRRGVAVDAMMSSVEDGSEVGRSGQR